MDRQQTPITAKFNNVTSAKEVSHTNNPSLTQNARNTHNPSHSKTQTMPKEQVV